MTLYRVNVCFLEYSALMFPREFLRMSGPVRDNGGAFCNPRN